MSANTVKKILNHVEKDKIIGKLINGESPTKVSEYLKVKFHEKDQAHLRLSQGALSEFRDKYLSQYKSLDQILQNDNAKGLKKKVAESLLENKTWRERQLQEVDNEIDLKKQIITILNMLQSRAEQIFDRIQEDPRVTKHDYVLIKYFDSLFAAIEKTDKLINDKPDQVVQHNVTVQMVEQHSYAFQDAIREFMAEVDPDMASRLMDLMTKHLGKLQDPDAVTPKKKTFGQKLDDVNKMLPPNYDEDDILSNTPKSNKNILDGEFEDKNNDKEQ